MTISRSLAECLMRLRNLDENKPLRDYLAAEAAQHDTFLRNSNQDRPVAVAQGMSRAVHGLIDLIEKAPELLEKQ